jgi:hypothetical protein
MTNGKRGRPTKFGRRSRVVALTLPEDILGALRQVHPDPARAIVKLVEGSSERASGEENRKPLAELVAVGSRRSLIVVDRWAFQNLPAVSLIPISDDRAFLAFKKGKDSGALELELIDRLEQPAVDRAEHDALNELRSCLREWRHDPALKFLFRSILILERGPCRSTSDHVTGTGQHRPGTVTGQQQARTVGAEGSALLASKVQGKRTHSKTLP